MKRRCLSACEPLILDLVRLMDQFQGGQPTVVNWDVVNDVELPRVNDGDYDFIVDWGDPCSEAEILETSVLNNNVVRKLAPESMLWLWIGICYYVYKIQQCI